MRRLVLGLGLGQVFLTSLAVSSIAVLAGFELAPAIVVGGSLALSSSAVGLRVLADRGELATQYGRASLSVLLVQDLAVVPLLTLIPLLGAHEATLLRALAEAGATAAAALLGIFLLGRLLFRPLLRLVAAGRSEIGRVSGWERG